MSGIEAFRRDWNKGKAKAADSLRPVLLIPTPAQIARGQLVIDVQSEDQICAAAKRLGKIAWDKGWRVRPTISHAQLPPSGVRREWKDAFFLALRVVHPQWRIQAYGIWENGHWNSGQAMSLASGQRTKEFGAKVFEQLLSGTLTLWDKPGGGCEPILNLKISA